MSDDDSSASSSASDSEEVPQQVVVKEKPTAKRKKAEKAGPKRPLSAYMFFCKDSRPGLKEANPELTFGELGKLLGKNWQAMGKTERTPYDESSKKDKERFESEGGSAAIAAAQGKNTKPKKAAKKGGPKRPLSAYMYFSQAMRPKLKEEEPDLSFAELGKAIGAKWKSATDDEKSKFNKMAATDKQRYKDEVSGVDTTPKVESEDAASESGSATDDESDEE